jgi:NDP-sugar pyrophosphorylase family protein
MKYYSAFDYNRFIICLGYKGYMIKEYFANYLLHQLARARANDGLIGGHDYTPDYESMMFAVNEFAEQTGLELHSVFPDWWFIVRDEKH